MTFRDDLSAAYDEPRGDVHGAASDELAGFRAEALPTGIFFRSDATRAPEVVGTCAACGVERGHGAGCPAAGLS